MCDSSVERPEIAAWPAILDQLEYLADELEAQLPLLARYPEAVLTAIPFEGIPSIAELYSMLEANESALCGRVLELCESEVSGWPDIPDPSVDSRLSDDEYSADGSGRGLRQLIGRIADMRRLTVKRMRLLDERRLYGGDDRKTIQDWAYNKTLEDSEQLHAISVRFYEIGSRF